MFLIRLFVHGQQKHAWRGEIGLVFLLTLLLVGCSGPNPVSTATPTPKLPPLVWTTFDLHLPPEALNAPIVGPLSDATVLHVSITFRVNQQELNKLQATPGQNLESHANQLGISDSEYQQIKQISGIQDATLDLNKLHTALAIDAKAKTFASVFQIQFLLHKLNGRTFYAPTSNPRVPALIVNKILAITGLDSYSLSPRTGVAAHTSQTIMARATPLDCNLRQNVLSPLAVAHFYGYDQFYKSGLNGEGITINLVEIDGFVKPDVQNYASCMNYRGHLKVVDLNTPPSPGEEATLDIEMNMGLTPAANIVVYETSDATFSSINKALQAIINDNVKNANSGSIVSISLGATERGITPGDVAAVDQNLQILTKAEHMTIFIASGDCAAFDSGTYGDLSVDFPASDPWAVSVGGTAPVLDQQKGIKETAWANNANHTACNNHWGSGGGLSTLFKRPEWQDAAGVQNKFSNGMRQIPDVSAFASVLTYYYLGHWIPTGGTSAAAPIWASGMALVNEKLLQQTQRFFFGPNLFYQVARSGVHNQLQPYTDVTQGGNLYYPATNNWDFATGLGTPNLNDFYNILVALAKQA
jgi:subtilase family serine protease